MDQPLPLALENEGSDLRQEIREAFANVDRKRGVSWSEAEVIDGYGSEKERKRARKLDRDSHWEELVEDPQWDPEEPGHWSFLDGFGIRYYLPAAMIRYILQRGEHKELADILSLGDMGPNLRSHAIKKWAVLDQRQKRAVRRFLNYMIALGDFKAETEAEEVWFIDELKEYYARDWRKALESYWDASVE